jgi:hypothetical protein
MLAFLRRTVTVSLVWSLALATGTSTLTEAASEAPLPCVDNRDLYVRLHLRRLRKQFMLYGPCVRNADEWIQTMLRYHCVQFHLHLRKPVGRRWLPVQPLQAVLQPEHTHRH